MTNIYKCAGLLLTRQYENTLIMAPSYMWQYHLWCHRPQLWYSNCRQVSDTEFYCFLIGPLAHLMRVRGVFAVEIKVKLKEWCDKYSSIYYHKGRKQLYNAIYLLGIIRCLSPRYRMYSSFRFMELFIQRTPALNLTQSPSEDLAHLAFWQSPSIQQQIIKWHIHYSADWVIIVYKCSA